MQKAINRMVLTLWISFPIYAVFATPERIEPDTYELMHMNINDNVIENPMKAEPSTIKTWQIYQACYDARWSENSDGTIEMGRFVCRTIQDAVYEQNDYEQKIQSVFRSKGGLDEQLELLSVISVTGCDISQLSRYDFAGYIISFGIHNEEELNESFFWNLEAILTPYCNQLRDSSIEFHLDENEERRRT